MGREHNSIEYILSMEKSRQALELRKAGCDYRTIADRVGYAGPSAAHKAVMRALKLTVREPAEEVRELEQSRLDQMLLALWPRVRQGDDQAIDRAIKIMDRRARLLGLDAPIRVNMKYIVDDVAEDEDLTDEEKASLRRFMDRVGADRRSGYAIET